MTQSMTTARDIPILVTSTASSSERRITPSWTVAHLKTKLEPVTGIAPSSQKLTLRLPDQERETPMEAEDEDTVQVGTWPLVAYAEIKVQIAYNFDVTLPWHNKSTSSRASRPEMRESQIEWSSLHVPSVTAPPHFVLLQIPPSSRHVLASTMRILLLPYQVIKLFLSFDP